MRGADRRRAQRASHQAVGCRRPAGPRATRMSPAAGGRRDPPGRCSAAGSATRLATATRTPPRTRAGGRGGRVAVALAAVAGALAGSGGDEDSHRRRQRRGVRQRRASLPRDLGAGEQDPEIPGLRLSDPLALAPRRDGRRARRGPHLGARRAPAPRRARARLCRASRAPRRSDARDGAGVSLREPATAGLQRGGDAVRGADERGDHGAGVLRARHRAAVLTECDDIAASLRLAGRAPSTCSPSAAYAGDLSAR